MIELKWYKRLAGNLITIPRHMKYRLKYGRIEPKSSELVYINPNEVDYFMTTPFKVLLNPYGYYVNGGDWDIRYRNLDKIFLRDFENKPAKPGAMKIDKYDFYISFKSHFDHGVSWENTILWERLNNTINSSKRSRYKSKSSIINRLNEIDELYEDMLNRGYLSQSELNKDGNKVFSQWEFMPEYNEVIVDVGRDGEFILDDGRHRFLLAKLIGFDQIPVRVFVRHPEWQKSNIQTRTQYKNNRYNGS